VKGSEVNRTKLKVSLNLWKRRVRYRENKLHSIRAYSHKSGSGPGHVSKEEAAHIHKWERLLSEARHMVNRRKNQLADMQPLRVRALAEAHKLVGSMEQGGNNMGAAVLALIRENGGTGPESWCGDFVAHCYRKAGSKVVQRGWAAVRFLGFLTGMRIRSVRDLLPGMIVTYTFDHTGIFVEYVKLMGNQWVKCLPSQATHIKTIEGNTGRSGAVSDSRTGGDGVYIKIRAIGLVSRGVEVTR
jgi:hypothetical protein